MPRIKIFLRPNVSRVDGRFIFAETMLIDKRLIDPQESRIPLSSRNGGATNCARNSFDGWSYAAAETYRTVNMWSADALDRGSRSGFLFIAFCTRREHSCHNRRKWLTQCLHPPYRCVYHNEYKSKKKSLSKQESITNRK